MARIDFTAGIFRPDAATSEIATIAVSKMRHESMKKMRPKWPTNVTMSSKVKKPVNT